MAKGMLSWSQDLSAGPDEAPEQVVPARPAVETSSLADSSTGGDAPDTSPSADTQETAGSDAFLVRRLRGGDGEAGAILVRRYDAMLVGYLRRLTGSDHLAEELHQQTWLSALEHLERFEHQSSGGFKAWLFRIATNKANDLFRSRGRETKAKKQLQLAREGWHVPTDHADTSEQVDKLREAIDKLPEPQRQVLLLRYYTDLKFVDIAEMLGCPLNTALGRMHKAMNKLKQMMDAPPGPD